MVARALLSCAHCVDGRPRRPLAACFRPEHRPPFVPLAKASVLGLFFNSILPARAGEAARIFALKSYKGTSVAETTATVVVERIADVTSLLLMLFVLVAWLPHVSWFSGAEIVAAGCLVGIVVLGFAVRRLRARPLPRISRSAYPA